MRRAGIAATTAAVMAASLLAGAAPPQQSAQGTFRATTDVVTVPVSVRIGNETVPGLTAADFTLTDNGVEQRIDGIDGESLPVDLTLVLDTSGSTELVVDALSRDVREIAALLRPIDRVRLMTIDTYATEVFPLQPGSGHVSFERITVNGLSAVHDTIAAALLRPVPLDRRHLIVAMTDGIDSVSGIAARKLEEIAARSDAVLNVLRVDTETALGARWMFACMYAGRCGREARYWIPYQDREFGAIGDAARATGGELRDQGLFSNRTAAAMFKTVFEDFRRSYLLRYTPRGVTRQGWHRIEVKLRGTQPYVVRARRGYAIDPPPRAAAPPAPRRAGVPLATLAEITAAYERGEFSEVADSIMAARDAAALVRDVRANGNPWPGNPRREAAFILEVADTALFYITEESRNEAYRLLEWYQRLVRHPLEPDGFERLWTWAQVALVQGVVLPTRAMPAVTNALKRFPNEARFHLARAVVLDQRWPRGTHESPQDGMGPAMPPRVIIDETLAAYEHAARFEDTRVEARVRQAFLLLRIGQPGDALEKLDVGDIRDKELVYLHRLFRGKALEAVARLDEADASYRAALEAWPGAQSARVAIMTLAMTRGQRERAEAMAETIETQPANSFDPFWQYWQADARFYGAIRALVRQQVPQ